MRPPVRSLTSATTASTLSASRATGTTASTSRLSGSIAPWSHQSPCWSSAESAGSQCSCFWKTNDHFSSNWTSRVLGGKGHQFVVELPGVVAGQPAVTDDGIAIHRHQSGGGADAVPLGAVLEDRQGLILGQLRPEQGRPLALGEPRLAGAAVQHPALLVLAVAGADRQVAEPALAVVGAVLVLATETGQVLCHGAASLIPAANGAGSNQ